MLQVESRCIRGVGNEWDDVIIPGLDFVVIENTLGKFGKRVEDFNAVPRFSIARVLSDLRSTPF